MSVHKIGKFGGDDNAKFEARMEAGKVALKRVEANTISLESDEFKFEARIYGENMLKIIDEILAYNNTLKDKLPKTLVEVLYKFRDNNNGFKKEDTEKILLMLRDYFSRKDQEINPILEKEVKNI